MTGHRFLILGLILFTLTARAQFPPPAGQEGSTAIPHDSACFKCWSDSCIVIRGYVNISDTTVTYEGNNHAYYGNDADAKGMPDEMVVSLGDGGTALLTFPATIGNGPGFDFAIFENSLSDTFLELAFVEVSSDGTRFIRFPSISHVQDTLQVSAFGSTDATLIHNFAGKYRALYGMPFDLDDIADSAGIDLQKVTHVRIADAVGCIQPPFATYDTEGHIVNEPWPTPFHSCGFDLDAVGVINTGIQGTQTLQGSPVITVFPNPAADHISVRNEGPPCQLSILSPTGAILSAGIPVWEYTEVSLTDLSSGLYFLRFGFPDGSSATRKVMKD